MRKNDIINNTIKVASKDSKNKPAILRGINGMQQSITQLTNSKYGKMVESYVALINSFEPMVPFVNIVAPSDYR